MNRIKINNRIYFRFKIRTRLIEKLLQGRELRSESEEKNTIYIGQIEIPTESVEITEDGSMIRTPPMELDLKATLILERDKRRRKR
ncbi:MAG: hypothetical protein DRP09_10385 [Candidatus Thorarchaeota archaeon]|nr:MAG: hypothetical protein DRP09_10385 [Candidatus Thorarchaeota archaeon]